MQKTTEIGKEKSAKSRSWVKEGIYYGLWMYLSMAILYPLLFDQPYVLKEMVLLFPFWIIAGLGYVFFFYRYLHKLAIKKKEDAEEISAL